MELKEKIEALHAAFEECSGNARTRINDLLVGFDEKTKEVFVKDYEKPTIFLQVSRFCELMSDEQAQKVANMPSWNGSNAYEMSSTLLNVVRDVLSIEHKIERT